MNCPRKCARAIPEKSCDYAPELALPLSGEVGPLARGSSGLPACACEWNGRTGARAGRAEGPDSLRGSESLRGRPGFRFGGGGTIDALPPGGDSVPDVRVPVLAGDARAGVLRAGDLDRGVFGGELLVGGAGAGSLRGRPGERRTGEGGAGPVAVVPTLRGRPGERRTGEGGALSELELILSKSNDSPSPGSGSGSISGTLVMRALPKSSTYCIEMKP